ncbi:MAG TPA: hypothetical protein VF339_18545 [Gammaproteobacteria bacterium]
MSRKIDWLSIAAGGDLTDTELAADERDLAQDERWAELSANTRRAADRFSEALRRLRESLEDDE